MADHTHELDYAPRSAREVRRAWIRRTVRVIFVLAASTALIALAVSLVRQALYLRFQRAAMTHVLPPETVIFHDVPTASAGVNPLWRLFSFNGPTAFSHARQTPDGRLRLAVVVCWLNQDGVSLLGAQYVPATLMLKSRTRVILPARITTLPLAAQATIFAGQPDPNDPTHFTIDYELDGLRITIDGWLTNDGAVKLEPRRQPAPAPATLNS